MGRDDSSVRNRDLKVSKELDIDIDDLKAPLDEEERSRLKRKKAIH